MTDTIKTRHARIPLVGTFLKPFVNGKTLYIPRFARVYQPKGHLFNQSFKVIRRGYWLTHKILSHDDVAIYETLQYFFEANETFTLEDFAANCGRNDKTIRKHFDALENAELLEIVSIADGRGRPNYYILRTPLFERAHYNDSIKEKIIAAGEDLPTTFLEDEAVRLRRKVGKNSVEKLRRLNRLRNNLPARLKPFTDLVIDHYTERKLAIHRVYKTLREEIEPDANAPSGAPIEYDYTRAANFDEAVLKATRRLSVSPDPENFEELADYYTALAKQKDEFRTILKEELKRVGVLYSGSMLGMASDLAAFYAPRIGGQPKNAGNKKQQELPNAAGTVGDERFDDANEREKSRSLLRNALDLRRQTRSLPGTAEAFWKLVSSLYADVLLSAEEILQIAANYYPADLRQKILVEKLE